MSAPVANPLNPTLHRRWFSRAIAPPALPRPDPPGSFPAQKKPHGTAGAEAMVPLTPGVTDVNDVPLSDRPGAAALRMVSDRLGMVLRELAEGDPVVQRRVTEAVELLLELHGAAFERVLALAADPLLGSPGLVTRLADDALIGPLLLAYGCHPHDVDTRVTRALARLAPQLTTAGCRVMLARIEGGAALVRVEGLAPLPAPSAAELTCLLETTVREIAPELSEVTIEPVPATSATASGTTRVPGGSQPQITFTVSER